jgi:deglycase
MGNLDNQRIAILVANGFEQVELTEPKKALEQAGASTDIVSPESGKVKLPRRIIRLYCCQAAS